MAGYYFDEQNDSNRDYPLTFRWRAPALAEALGLLPAPNDSYRLVRDTILAELMLASEVGKALSFSRHKPFYKRSRYRCPAFTYDITMRVVAEIVQAGLGIENRTQPGHRGWQSTITATPALFGMMVNPTYDRSGETIILRSRGDDHALIDYVDTKETRRLRAQVGSLNEMLASMTIEVPDGIRDGNHLRFNKQYVRVVPGNGGRRIFTDNWSLHGRFYCWPQNVPSAARATMTINAEPAVELDYAAMHPTMLYCRMGQKLDGDPYDVGGGFERSEVKLGMVIAINAKTGQQATAALAHGRGIAHARAAKVIAAIRKRHQPIQGAICSDAGIRLMNHDSKIMMAVTTALIDDGIASVPVHDSIVVPARFAGQARAKMIECWSSYYGSVNPCSVS